MWPALSSLWARLLRCPCTCPELAVDNKPVEDLAQTPHLEVEVRGQGQLRPSAGRAVVRSCGRAVVQSGEHFRRSEDSCR